MDFFTIIFLLCLYYVRPHEWIGIFKILPVVKLTFFMALLSLFHKRGLGFKNIVHTPQDWMMLVYFLWMIGTSPTPYVTFKYVLPLYCFYVVAVVTLDSTLRMQKFLNWWAFFIVVLAALAVASMYGFDPTLSLDVTMGRMKGRLAFNTSIFNNANALGHSVVPVVVMLYFIGFWKRPVFVKILTLAVVLIPIYCVWLTVSKGSFLTGFATMLVAVTFRRPLGVQLFIVLLAATMGVVGVQMLPRMEEISASKTDQAIQGRVAAFRFGMEQMENKLTGVGWAEFENQLFHHLHFHKAPHSSYVRVGGELGFPGLFMFLGIIYCGLRTLLFAHTENDDEERLRRILFVMLISYIVSSWMVGWADRATFFLMIATISAFHRYLETRHTTTLTEETKESEVTVSEPEVMQPNFLPPIGGALVKSTMAPPMPVAKPTSEILFQAAFVQLYLEKIAGIRWKKVGLVDLLIIGGMTLFTYFFWHYVMNKM